MPPIQRIANMQWIRISRQWKEKKASIGLPIVCLARIDSMHTYMRLTIYINVRRRRRRIGKITTTKNILGSYFESLH